MAVALFALCLALPAGAGAFGSTLQWKGASFMPVLKATNATWEGKLVMTETEGWEKTNKLSVECKDKFEGSVNTGGSGEITKLVSSECNGINAKNTMLECSATNKLGTNITASDLPWRTEVVKSELGPPIVRVIEDGKGTPVLKLSCLTLGLTTEDTCTGNLALNVTQMAPTVGAFDNKEALNCTFSGKPTGHVEGSQTLAGVGGLEEGTPVWNVSGEHAVSWSKGTLTVLGSPGIGVTCEESGEGTVSTAGVGSITKVTLTKCTKSIESECSSGYSLEALDLPWKTQLYFGELESLDNAIAPGGSGAVAFKIKCEIRGLPTVDTCESTSGSESSGRLGTKLTNGVESGVKALYSSQQRLRCSHSGTEVGQVYESSHTIKLTGGGTLAVSG